LELNTRETGPTIENAHGEDRYTDVFGSVREARAAIFALGLTAELGERAALVVSELATNAVLHAGGLLHVRIWYDNRRLRIEVADGSPKLPAPGTVTAMSGRGLQIVTALANSWGWQIRPGGKVVWAELE
jgi:anti-sigma regulatory factor (Ser/Thr protein kinase)